MYACVAPGAVVFSTMTTRLVAGGGFRRGGTYGATDEFGHHAVENVVNHFDYHATLLDQFGLPAEQLAFKRGGREETLLDGQPGKIVQGILA